MKPRLSYQFYLLITLMLVFPDDSVMLGFGAKMKPLWWLCFAFRVVPRLDSFYSWYKMIATFHLTCFCPFVQLFFATQLTLLKFSKWKFQWGKNSSPQDEKNCLLQLSRSTRFLNLCCVAILIRSSQVPRPTCYCYFQVCWGNPTNPGAPRACLYLF